jgi:hypothetical protein
MNLRTGIAAKQRAIFGATPPDFGQSQRTRTLRNDNASNQTKIKQHCVSEQIKHRCAERFHFVCLFDRDIS